MAPATLHPTDHPHLKHAGLLRRKELFAWAQAAMEIAWTPVYVSVRTMKSIGWNQEQIMHMVCKLIISQWLHRSTRFPIARWMVVGILILLQDFSRSRYLQSLKVLCHCSSELRRVPQRPESESEPPRRLQSNQEFQTLESLESLNCAFCKFQIKSTAWRVLTRLTPSNCNYFPGTNQ